jgi:hypothetical protein
MSMLGMNELTELSELLESMRSMAGSIVRGVIGAADRRGPRDADAILSVAGLACTVNVRGVPKIMRCAVSGGSQRRSCDRMTQLKLGGR